MGGLLHRPFLGVQPAIRLDWQMQPTGEWWPFEALNTLHPGWGDPFGVYVIATGLFIPTQAARLGQGQIMDRIARHKLDDEVRRAKAGQMWVTWARVDGIASLLVDGIEKFLATQLEPIAGSAFPQAEPVAVNLPRPLASRPQARGLAGLLADRTLLDGF